MVLPDPAPAIEIIVRGVCLSRGHLLVCRNVSRGNVYLPGGHVEWGESSPSALRREWRIKRMTRSQKLELIGHNAGIT